MREMTHNFVPRSLPFFEDVTMMNKTLLVSTTHSSRFVRAIESHTHTYRVTNAFKHIHEGNLLAQWLVKGRQAETLTLPTDSSGTHCNTLQHTATHCNKLQHTATHWDYRPTHRALNSSTFVNATHWALNSHIGYSTAQEWRNCTLVGNEPLVCSKMYFSKTELVQQWGPMVQYVGPFFIWTQLGSIWD